MDKLGILTGFNNDVISSTVVGKSLFSFDNSVISMVTCFVFEDTNSSNVFLYLLFNTCICARNPSFSFRKFLTSGN